jgi:hypothetical protein
MGEIRDMLSRSNPHPILLPLQSSAAQTRLSLGLHIYIYVPSWRRLSRPSGFGGHSGDEILPMLRSREDSAKSDVYPYLCQKTG